MNNIYNRPMFQNPQQRAGAGIMAGVAPINMANGGDTSLFSQENIDQAAEIATFFFDPNDPIDQASLALMFFPPAAAIARLTSMGIKGAKLYNQMSKIDKASNAAKEVMEKSVRPSMALAVGLQVSDAVRDPDIQNTVGNIGDNFKEIADVGGQIYEQRFGDSEPQQTLGQRTNNPFNVRYSKSNDWQGADTSIRERGYEGFENADYGIRAADRVLENYGKKGISTLRDALDRYAPSSENPTESYIDFISEKTNIDPDAEINLEDPSVRALIMSPMATFESKSTYSPNEISEAINRANNNIVVDSDEELNESSKDGGISNIINSIFQAREEKSPTFMRGDEELAAVTKEELEKSGFDSLKDYLNNMNFNSESGRYEPEGMANGGIMKLKDGSGPDGVEEKVISPDVEGLLNKYNISLEEFLKYPDEKQQAYLDTYRNTLDFKKSLVNTRGGPASAEGVAGVLDAFNSVLEAPSNIYEAAKYSDLGRVLGFSDPDQERPDDDASFAQDIKRIREAQAPTLDEIQDLAPQPPEVIATPPEPEVVEPGLIQKALGAVGKIAGFDLPEDERQAMLIATQGRRKYGVSRAEAYNDALAKIRLNEAQVKELESRTDARGTSDIEQSLEYLKTLFPKKKPSELVNLYLSKGKNQLDNQTIGNAILEQVKIISENFMNYQEGFEEANVRRASENIPEIQKEDYITQLATAQVYRAFGIAPTNTTESSISMSQEDIDKYNKVE